jgi:hypothetical protein
MEKTATKERDQDRKGGWEEKAAGRFYRTRKFFHSQPGKDAGKSKNQGG